MTRSFKIEQTIQQQIFDLVRQIPQGKVASYGQISRIVGLGISAQMVGFALASLKEGTDVPWQRVINSQGKISLPGMGGAIQKSLLLDEGIEFDEKNRVDFERFGWEGPGS
jgi:methylated-DNA-protein-cysteine methyltransferase-like protein